MTLVAASSASDLGDGEVSLFPTESTAGVAFSQAELFSLSVSFGVMHRQLTTALAQALSAATGLHPKAAAVIGRDAGVPLCHVFFDRLLRLHRFLEGAQDCELAVAASAWSAPQRMDQIKASCATSRGMNQRVLEAVAPVWNLPRHVAGPFVAPRDRARPVSPRPFVNYNFAGRTPLQKVRARLSVAAARQLGRLSGGPPLGRVPVLSMGYATGALQGCGFYGPSGFADLRGFLRFPTHARDNQLRRDISRGVGTSMSSAICRFLRENGVASALHERAQEAFRQWLVDMLPQDLVEGGLAEVSRCDAVLQRYRRGSLLLSEFGSQEATYYVAAARQAGRHVVGIQEGGHYGYEADFMTGVESVYPHCDRFVTWGWTALPDRPECARTRTVPLPSPWLSERARHWRHVRHTRRPYPATKPYDFLLMANKVYEYPPAPSGGDVSRIDHIHAFSAMMADIIGQATRRGFRLLNKPYNKTTERLIAPKLEAVVAAAGDRYGVVERPDKGLFPELVDECHVVLWDQPGTGFLECLVSGLPSMVYWPRIYNQETEQARDAFATLEREGLVHRTLSSLFDEMHRYKQNPSLWMADPGRAAATGAFCGAYASTSAAWTSDWRAFVRSI